jgi:hypothetical protein
MYDGDDFEFSDDSADNDPDCDANQYSCFGKHGSIIKAQMHATETSAKSGTATLCNVA